MKRVSKARIALLALFVFLLCVGGQSAYAQNTGERYFPETGHWVGGEFLAFYEGSIPNPEFVYGYPITEELTDQVTGRRVQYFQRARFEFRQEHPPGERVQLSPLGQLLYTPGQALEVPLSSAACRQFPNNPNGPYQVCYSFLDFYESHGGFEQFGYPISPLEYHSERVMQYFEFARLEWHPERPSGLQITLGNLGELYFKARGEGIEYRLPSDNRPEDQVIDLRPRAFLKSAVVPAGGTQTLFVTVHDQNLLPVTQAQVTMVVQYPSGESESNLLQPTDSDGVTSFSYRVNSTTVGPAEVIVSITHGRLSETVHTSFQIWW